MSPTPCETILLPDGRHLAYAVYGAFDGQPLFYFHGFPGSRLEGGLIAPEAAERGLKVIGVDRPGFGASDPRADRTLLDWADDVAALADALGHERFAVVGVSGGAPFALATARQLPDRVKSVNLVCGLGPPEAQRLAPDMLYFNRLGLSIARSAPWVSAPVFATITPLMRWDPEPFLDHLARLSEAPDQRALADPRVRRVFVASMREAFCRGGHGPARDGVLYANPWGFDLGDVSVPVRLWHGELDRIVPVAIGRFMAERIPGVRAEFFPDDGHFSLAMRLPQMMDELAGDEPAA